MLCIMTSKILVMAGNLYSSLMCRGVVGETAKEQYKKVAVD